MPCTDPRDVACLADAFDVTTTAIRPWELELIWAATSLGVMTISRHADEAALDDNITPPALFRVIREGIPRSKDIDDSGKRWIGINFEGKIAGGRWVRLKVSWQKRYVIVTVHTL